MSAPSDFDGTRQGSPPDADPASGAEDLSLLTLAELRVRRQKLTELEGQVSYWRRIIQARLDLLRDGSIKRGATVEGLQRVLSQHLGHQSRLALINTQPGEDLPPIEGLSHLWNRGINATPDEAAALDIDLIAAEKQLSARRAELFKLIDAATAELISRYRDNPVLALTALPSRDPRPSPL